MNFDWFDWKCEQARRVLEAANAPFVGVPDSWVIRSCVQEELRISVIVGGSQHAVSSADSVPVLQADLGFPGDGVGRHFPFVMPTIVVAGLDSARCHDDLAKLSAAIVDRAKAAQRFEPELVVVPEYKSRHCVTIECTLAYSSSILGVGIADRLPGGARKYA